MPAELGPKEGLAPLNGTLGFALGRTVPIKFQLTDARGSFISSLTAVVSLQALNAQVAFRNMADRKYCQNRRCKPASNLSGCSGSLMDDGIDRCATH